MDGRIKEWLESHDGEDYCRYCPFDDECAHGMSCYGGAPIEPPCCSTTMEELLDLDWLLEDIEAGEWDD